MKNERLFAQKLTSDDEKILGKQVIDGKRPGSILTDFEGFLDFIGRKGVPVIGKMNNLTEESLREINPLMTKSLDIDPDRPPRKWLPNISGLYLLLMAMGLGVVRYKGDKRFLLVDADVLGSWSRLGPVERYFTLLETWLLNGNRGIIDDGGFDRSSPYLEWSNFRDAMGKNGLESKGRDTLDPRGLSHSPGFHNIALMEMFGLISVRDSEPEKGSGRRIDAVRGAPFGDALGKLLQGYFAGERFFHDREDGAALKFGRLQEIVTPFFPDWQNNLTPPRIEFKDGVYIFKTSLQQAWRRIAAPGSNLFDDLGKAILEAFEFQDDHLYWFTYQNRRGVEETIYHPYMEGASTLTDGTRIGEIGLEPGSGFAFIFDFGDLWTFRLRLESIEPADPGLEKPKVIEADGAPPAQYPEWDESTEWVFDDD